LPEFVLVAITAGLAGLVQGLTGFGYSVVLVMTLVTSGQDVATSSMVAMVTCAFCQTLVLYRLRGRPALFALWPLLVGTAVALPAGLLILKTSGDAPWLRRVLGAFVVTAAAWLLAMPDAPKRTRRGRPLLGVGAGILSGLGVGLFNTGGPPAALYLYSRRIPLETARRTIQLFFLVATAYRLVVSLAGGMVTSEVVLRGLGAVPLVVGGTLAGLALSRRVRPKLLRRVIYVALAVLGLKLVLWA